MLNSVSQNVLANNQTACQALAQGQVPRAFALASAALEQVRQLPASEERAWLLLVTYTSFGKLYCVRQNFPKAQWFFSRATELEREVRHQTQAVANLSLAQCELYSVLGEHEKALRFAIKASKLLEVVQDAGVNLPIAFHNMGIEYEHLGLSQDALDSYYKAYTCSLETLDSRHPVATKVKRSIDALNKVCTHKVLPRVSRPATKARALSRVSSHHSRGLGTPKLARSSSYSHKRRVSGARRKKAALVIQRWWRTLQGQLPLAVQIKKAQQRLRRARLKLRLLNKEQRLKKQLFLN